MDISNSKIPTIHIKTEDLPYFKKLAEKNQWLLLDVKTQQEGCMFAAEANIKIIKDQPDSNNNYIQTKIDNVPIYLSPLYMKYFSSYFSVQLVLKKFPKEFICTNIDPFVTKSCGCKK